MALIGLLLFILIPIIEIVVLIQVGDLIGFWYTVGIVIFTAIAGTTLLRRQGMALFMNANQKLARGQLPLEAFVDGIGIAFAGALLLTPGFVTDIFGLSLFFPPWRRILAKAIANKFMVVGHWGMKDTTSTPHTYDTTQTHFDEGAGPIIEGEFTPVEPEHQSQTKSKPSPWKPKPKP